MKKMMDINTPIINSAVAWKAAAQKKVQKLFRGTHGKRARDSEMPKDVSLELFFTKGGTLDFSGSAKG